VFRALTPFSVPLYDAQSSGGAVVSIFCAKH
jgi:hypothetical protein